MWLVKCKELTPSTRGAACGDSCCHNCRFAVGGECQLESTTACSSGKVTFKLNVHDRQGIVYRSWTSVVDAVGSWDDKEIHGKNRANKRAQSVLMNRYPPTGTAAWALYRVTRSYLQYASLSRSRSSQRSNISLPKAAEYKYNRHIRSSCQYRFNRWLTWHVNRVETVHAVTIRQWVSGRSYSSRISTDDLQSSMAAIGRWHCKWTEVGYNRPMVSESSTVY